MRSTIDVFTYPLQDYIASYEIASANLEGLIFDKVGEIREDKPLGNPGDNQAGMLDGSDPDRRIGTSLLLKVMAGDRVAMNVNNFHEGYDPQHDVPVTAADMLASIVSTLTGGVGSMPGEVHDTKMVDQLFNSSNYLAIDGIVNNTATDPSKPKAYLNYVLFDEGMRIVQEMTGAFQAGGNGSWEAIGTQVPLEVPQNGYLAVYLSNASSNIVYFDQLWIQVSKGNLLEETHYYPHGLPIFGLSDKTANGYKENKRKYQSNEYNKDMGLNWMDFQARQYDPQIGRFLGVDPLAEAQGQQIYSPYAAMGNMPEVMIDPNGTTFTVSGDMDMARKILDGWLGHDNYALDDNGKVSIGEDHKAAALANLTAYFVQNNIGGGSAGTSQQMAADAAAWVMAMIGDDTKNVNMNAKGNGLISMELGYYSNSDFNITEEDGDMRFGIENGMNAVLKAQAALAAAKPDGLQQTKDVTDALAKGTIIPDAAMDFVENTSAGRRLATGTAEVTEDFSRVMTLSKPLGKTITAVNLIATGVAIGNDWSKGRRKSAAARATVAGVATVAAFIPGVGWGISLGIGIADAIWGDEFYDYVQKNW